MLVQCQVELLYSASIGMRGTAKPDRSKVLGKMSMMRASTV